MNYSEYEAYRKYLSDDEYILWQGRPRSRRPFMVGDLAMILFSLIWSSFVIKFEISAIRSGNIPFMLFGIPFVTIGLYLLAGRFIHERIIYRNTVYIITNRKICRIYKGSAEMLYLNDLPPMQTRIFKDGGGTISFNTGYRYNSFGARSQRQLRFELLNIPDCAMVEQIIFDNMENR